MNKRKIMMLALSLCMVAILAVGGTLAYFTDTDSKTNTFTLGKVDIKLEETFPETKLLPGEKNALTKSVKVTNETGSEDAYMWIELWIPEKIDAIGDPAANSLHFNPFDTYKDSKGSLVQLRGSEAKKLNYTLFAETVEVPLGTKQIGDVKYNGYREYIKNDTAKKAGESTYPLLSRVFMDQRVAQCTDASHENCLILADGQTHYTGSWEIIVNAFGIQADGFNNIEEAIAAYNAQ